MIILVKNTNQKNHVFLMIHVFSQNEHHFSQVEPFEKPWFLVMGWEQKNILLLKKNITLTNLICYNYSNIK
jgi:hypothetical protein